MTTSAHMTGPYDIQPAAVSVVGVTTNKTPGGSYRGYGVPEAVFALERFIDEVAAEVGVDRLDLRRSMLLDEADLPYTTPSGALLDSGSFAESFEKAVELGERAFERARRPVPHGSGFAGRCGLRRLLRGRLANPPRRLRALDRSRVVLHRDPARRRRASRDGGYRSRAGNDHVRRDADRGCARRPTRGRSRRTGRQRFDPVRPGRLRLASGRRRGRSDPHRRGRGAGQDQADRGPHVGGAHRRHDHRGRPRSRSGEPPTVGDARSDRHRGDHQDHRAPAGHRSGPGGDRPVRARAHGARSRRERQDQRLRRLRQRGPCRGHPGRHRYRRDRDSRLHPGP